MNWEEINTYIPAIDSSATYLGMRWARYVASMGPVIIEYKFLV
jgi:hypothetical protein